MYHPSISKNTCLFHSIPYRNSNLKYPSNATLGNVTYKIGIHYLIHVISLDIGLLYVYFIMQILIKSQVKWSIHSRTQ